MLDTYEKWFEEFLRIVTQFGLPPTAKIAFLEAEQYRFLFTQYTPMQAWTRCYEVGRSREIAALNFDKEARDLIFDANGNVHGMAEKSPGNLDS